MGWLQALAMGMIIVAFAIMLLLYLIAGSNYGEKKLRDAILDSSPYRRAAAEKLPNNSIQARNRVLEARQARLRQEMQEMGVVRYNPDGLVQSKMTPRIVGLAEVKGFWSRFIMGQKLGYLKMRASLNFDNQNFWVTLIKAQAASQGKDQSRGR